jgi:hypothetical protein
MKKTLVTAAAAFVVCASTQLYAQLTKEDVITFALTWQYQSNVTTDSKKQYAGKWSDAPRYYQTKTLRLSTANIIQNIGAVLKKSYTSKAQLVLVTGFFNVSPDLQAAVQAQHITGVTPFTATNVFVTNYVYCCDYTNTTLGGLTNLCTMLAATNHLASTNFVPPCTTNSLPGWLYTGFTVTTNLATNIVSGFNTNYDNSLGQFEVSGIDSTLQGIFPDLATGRHFQPIPDTDASGNPVPARVGQIPVGHQQPWGQIFIRDTGHSPMTCDNVTFFFAITVEECYDCFFLNSFISDAQFSFSSSSSGLPPCCDVPQNLLGKGKDRYYMRLSFDNTYPNNPYLDDGSPLWVGWGQKGNSNLPDYNPYAGIKGIIPFPPIPGVVDGVAPDGYGFVDSIASKVGTFNPAAMRFALNGIVTYTWNLKVVNTDYNIVDYVGNADYPVTGYGFVKLFCSLFNGDVKFTEKIVKTSACCLDLPWYDSWYGIGLDTAGNSADQPSPVNFAPSLSYHNYFDEEYEPGEQAGTEPPAPTGTPGP